MLTYPVSVDVIVALGFLFIKYIPFHSHLFLAMPEAGSAVARVTIDESDVLYEEDIQRNPYEVRGLNKENKRRKAKKSSAPLSMFLLPMFKAMYNMRACSGQLYTASLSNDC